MHPDLSLVINITVAVFAAFIGGFAARKVGLPALVGYLIAGLCIGPFTPGFIGDHSNISQLAEMGVIFMMFGVGLHFSLKDLWRVRSIAVPGAILQMLLATGLGLLLALHWGWTVSAGLVLGLAISIASTVVLLRGLVDNNLLNTKHGQVAVGWLVLEDLATIAILVLLPSLVGDGVPSPWTGALIALAKTACFTLLMMIVGKRFLPWVLTHSAYTRSKEIFILAVIALALGIALGAAELFGVSLALGAFLAGAVIAESKVNHQVSAEIGPFRDVFTVLFFVSVGMMVDPRSLLNNAGQVFALVFLIVVGKGILTVLLGFVLPARAKTMLVVAAGLSQIGEFSFIIGQAGMMLKVITPEQYSLLLTGAVIAIVLNPFLFKIINPAHTLLQKTSLYAFFNRSKEIPMPSVEELEGHVVVVGCGRVGNHLVTVLQQLEVPFVVVEKDAEKAEEFAKRGIPTLLGDASNSEILTHTNLNQAHALVVCIPDEATAELIVMGAYDLAPNVPLIVRAATDAGIKHMKDLGAKHIIHPEFEGALEVLRHTLVVLGYPVSQIQKYADNVRQDSYDAERQNISEKFLLDQLVSAIRGIEISWHIVGAKSPFLGKSLADVNLRTLTGASIIAVVRNEEVFTNPEPDMVFQAEDALGLLGNLAQIAKAERLLANNG